MWCCHILAVIVIVLLYKNYQEFHNIDHTVILETTLGKIRGLKCKGYNSYFGVPYAAVDRENPFGQSLPYPKFDSIYDATEECPQYVCPQIKEMDSRFAGSLDCLWINIYVPNSANANNLLPIFVWFPGGKFKFGCPGKYIYGPKYLVKQEIIFITVSSRLGVYGYFCLDTPKVPGNQGLKDQIAALRWIKKYIMEWHGNPDKVTIGGSSSSAFGVDLLLRSNIEGLFNSAIIQSGSAEYTGVMVDENRDLLFNISNKLGLETNNLTDALNFLAVKEPRAVIQTSYRHPVGPCVEKEFDNMERLIDKHPVDSEIRNPNISVLIGNTDGELLSGKGRIKIPNEESAKLFIEYKLSSIFNLSEPDEMIDTIYKFYIKTNEIKTEYMNSLMDFYSDIVFFHPTMRFLEKYLRNGGKNAFYYIFSYVGGRNFLRNRQAVECNMATHAEELGYLFDVSYKKAPNDQDQLIVDRMTTLWANFVKYGDPTPVTTKLLPVKWLPFNGKNYFYYNITSELSLGSRIYHERMAFWDQLYRKYGHLVKY